jgi:FKBP-type peptidyl-prolyl cis-trans isomerase SlpA
MRLKRITLLRYITGKLSDGQVFDTSEGKEPLEFTLGQGKLIAGFEKG